MNLEDYFTSLIKRVEESDIQNNGKDEDGFWKPTRAVILQRLHVLKDLHGKPRAKPMVRDAWQYIVENLPPEWLVLDSEQKAAIKKMLE